MSQAAYSPIKIGNTKVDIDRLLLFAKLYKVHPSDLIIASNVTITFNDKADAVNN